MNIFDMHVAIVRHMQPDPRGKRSSQWNRRGTGEGKVVPPERVELSSPAPEAGTL
ncbi:uncharacterized protein METZ01_LOCUS71114, partial [marine metagenome]